MPEGASFFGGLLKGFGGTLLDAQQQQRKDELAAQQQEAEGNKILLNFLLQGVENRMLDPRVANRFIAQTLVPTLESFGVGKGKGKGGAGGIGDILKQITDPANFEHFLNGTYEGVESLLGVGQVPFLAPEPAPEAGPGIAGLPGRALPPEIPPPGVTSAVPAAAAPAAAPAPPSAVAPGLLVPGTIDMSTRPRVQNPDGSFSSIRAMSFEENGREILVPTLADDGRQMTGQEAIDLYHQTGKHLGMFDTPDHATEYSKALSARLGQPTLADVPPPVEGEPPTPVFRTSVQEQLPQPVAAPAPPYVEPPPPPRPPPRLWNTPEQQQEQLGDIKASDVAATSRGTLQGRMQAVDLFVKDAVARYRREQHREPKLEEVQAMRRQGEALFLGGADTATAPSYGEGNIVPDPKSPTGYSQQLYNTRNPGDIRTIPAPAPRMAEGNIVPDPMSATGWSQELYDPTDRTRTYKIPAPSPFSRSTAQPNEIGLILYELFGDPAQGDEPRNMTRQGRLTPDQIAKGQAVKADRDAVEQAKITAAREEEQRKAAGKTLLTPDEAAKLQTTYGVTREQAAQLARTPLTTSQVDAAGASFAFENDATQATKLFEKVWPRVANPETRRIQLGLLQRNQNPDFVELQGILARMPSRLAVMEQGARPSDADVALFRAGLPKTAPEAGNWGIVDVPTSYEAGLQLLTAAKNVATSARTSIGIVSPEERKRVPPPPTGQRTPSAHKQVNGMIYEAATGRIIAGGKNRGKYYDEKTGTISDTPPTR